MVQRGRRLLATTLASWMTVSCGGAPAPRVAETAPLVIPPATVAPRPAPPPPPSRPKTVGAWIHVDDPAALVDLLGVTSSSIAQEVQPYLDLVDLRQPIDVAVVVPGDTLRDAEVAVRITLRDVRGAIDKATEDGVPIKDDGNRLHLKKGSESDEDEVVCDLGPSRSAETAICGTPKGLDAVGEWLKSAPAPAGDENARAGKTSSIARALLLVDVLAKEAADDAGAAADPDRAKDKQQERLLWKDMQSVAIELGREGNGLAFAVTTRLRSAESEVVSDLFTAASTERPNEPFFRIWQDAQGAVFLPGGAMVAKWTKKAMEESSLASAPKAQAPRKDAAAKLAAALERPFVGGYGVRADRARTAIAAVRTAKDPTKATHALEQALDAYVVYRLALELPKTEAMMKSFVAAWNAEDDANPFYASSVWDTKTPPKKGQKRTPRWAMRPAPARLGMPKGSFFVDETKVDWHTYLAASSPGSGVPKGDVESTLFVPDGAGGTWAASGPDDAACAESVKKLLAPAAPKSADDPLFARKGLVAAGYLSPLAGTFTMHKVQLASTSSSSSSLPPASTLAEIEHDLATPRQPLPFVLAAERQGAGGIASFEIRGERDAFKTISEHARDAMAGGVALFMMYAMLKGIGKP